VYDYAHIGHWFNYIRMDTLIRVLRATEMQPNWIMNITDVGHLTSDADEGEDKLEKGAKREGKTAWEVAEFYTRDFLECMRMLNISTPEHIVKATDHIAEQIALIERLEAENYTYIIDDGVYYDTSKFEGYAAFAQLDLDEQQAGARVSYNSQKKNASDFAVWKFSPTDHKRDMEWESPWGVGFPGWHIECSAMSMKYLGDTIDIHTGGIDHIPVHHTNEIAQSEAATGKRFANYWLHSNHVTVNGEKISKSLGNGIRLQEIMERGIEPAAVRLHVLESHYRSQAKFSWESLEAAQNRLKHWQSVAVLRWQPLAVDNSQLVADKIASIGHDIRMYLENDLNTPQVLSLVDELFSLLETELVNEETASLLEAFLGYIKDVLGIDLLEEESIPLTVLTLIHDRSSARAAQDWERADRIRAALSKEGIGVRDTPSGAIWFRQ